MRIRITNKGIYNHNGPVPIGTELDVSDDFKGWQGKWIRVDSPNATLEVATPEKEYEPDRNVEPPKPEVSEDLELLHLRNEYERTYGERPHARMKAETIRRKIEEAE